MVRYQKYRNWQLAYVTESIRLRIGRQRMLQSGTLEKHKRDVDELKNQTERTKRKEQWIAEALRKLGSQIRVHSISPLMRFRQSVRSELNST